jgi:hypothetical protein
MENLVFRTVRPGRFNGVRFVDFDAETIIKLGVYLVASIM